MWTYYGGNSSREGSQEATAEHFEMADAQSDDDARSAHGAVGEHNLRIVNVTFMIRFLGKNCFFF